LSRRKSRRSSARSNTRYYLVGGVALLAVIAIIGVLLAPAALQGHATSTTSHSSSTAQSTSATGTAAGTKPIILYVNQGNGVVNESNFSDLLYTATSNGFNTIFFQIYRSGTLLFASGSLSQFVASAHEQDLEIFFALYFTNTTQAIPSSIYNDGEDGISLDMSTLPIATQTTLFDQLSSSYKGLTAITTTDPSLPLSPDLLVVETYAPGDQQYIRPGMIAGVEVVATTSQQDYENQVQYALANSDGVMVFDYAGLLKSGY
jgi:hypothetical protein